MTMPRRSSPSAPEHAEGPPAAAAAVPAFDSWGWRAGNALVSALARLGIGPIELLHTDGRRTGRRHTVPVVPVEHAGSRWLVAPYGPVAWVHNVRAAGTATLQRGRWRRAYTVREAAPEVAGPVLRRYAQVAARARRCFATSLDSPDERWAAEAAGHPVFELTPHQAPPAS